MVSLAVVTSVDRCGTNDRRLCGLDYHDVSRGTLRLRSGGITRVLWLVRRRSSCSEARIRLFGWVARARLRWIRLLLGRGRVTVPARRRLLGRIGGGRIRLLLLRWVNWLLGRVRWRIARVGVGDWSRRRRKSSSLLVGHSEVKYGCVT